MFKSSLLIAAFISLSFAELFQIEKGNVWIYSFLSSSTPVVLNPSTITDSGTVKWEIMGSLANSNAIQYMIKQTRTTCHRTVSQGTQILKDSIIDPAIVTYDTLKLYKKTNGNTLSFTNDSCAFMILDKSKVFPSSFRVVDTTVVYNGLVLQGVKTTPPDCASYKNRAYTMLSVDLVGPVAVMLSNAAGSAGSNFNELWKIISREYPTNTMENRNTERTSGIFKSFTNGMINLSLPNANSITLTLLNVNGRVVAVKNVRNTIIDIVNFSWDISSSSKLLPNGNYYLKVNCNNNEQIYQIPLFR